MRGEILIVPTPPTVEMLKKSAQVLAKHLAKSGIKLNEQISICPDRRRLQHAISKGLERSEILFILGGMGKDSQFLSKQVVSEGLGLPLTNSREVLMAIRDYSTRTGIPASADDVTLASLPSGSKPLIPVHGVIPGCIVSSSSQHIVMLPENIDELGPMLSRQVIPMLSRVGVQAESVHFIKTYGATEDQIRKLIADYMGTSNPIVTTRAEGNEVVVNVVASGLTSTDAAQLSSPVLRSIVNRLGDYAYGLDVNNLETSLLQKLKRKNLTIASAESGTNKRLSARINAADKAGVSLGSIICDGIEAKVAEFDIKKRLFKKEGEVSEYTAVVLANGAREKYDSNIGVGISTNIVDSNKNEDFAAYIAVCDSRNVYIKKIYIDHQNSKNTGAIIDAAVSSALNMSRLFVDYSPNPHPHSVPLNKALARKVNVTDQKSYNESEFDDTDYPEFDYEDEDSETEYKEKSSVGRKIRNFIMLFAVLAVIVPVVYFSFYTVQSFAARAMRDDLSSVYKSLGIGGLKALNGDTVGYVEIEDTILHYPVVQSDDNKYYLRRDFTEKNNDNGIPFMDYRADVNKPSDNMLIYGHNMRDGQLFGELLNYKDLEYYKSHPLINFETTHKNGVYKIFAVYITSANAEHFGEGSVYDYTKFVNAESDEDFSTHVDEARIRSLLHLPVDVVPGDEIITLSTCDYDFFDSRYVVLARRVRTGESKDVDVDIAEYNPTPLYPDVWYSMYGGRKPDVNAWEFPLPLSSQGVLGTNIEKDEKADIIVSKPSDTPKDDNPKEETAVEPVIAKAEVEDTIKKSEDDAKKTEETKAAETAKTEEAKIKAEKEKAELEAKQIAEAEAKKLEEEKQGKIAIAEAEIKKQLDIASEAYTNVETNKQQTFAATIKTDATSYFGAVKDYTAKIKSAFDSAKLQQPNANTDTANTYISQIDALLVNAQKLYSDSESYYNSLSEAAEATKPNASLNTGAGSHSGGLRVTSSVSYDPDSDLDILSRIVQQEVGASFNAEAIKAQAVAAYSYIANRNSIGIAPSVYMASSVDPKVKNAVSEVLGQAVYYEGRPAYTTYHAINAGVTTNAISAWGGSYDYDYLQSVDSSVDASVSGYKVTKRMSSTDVANRLQDVLGIDATGDPSEWFKVLSYDAGVYNKDMTVCGYDKSQKKGSKITGPLLREYVLNLRSAAFDIEYDAGSDSFVFTTYGYGHGVGMSQKGANEYAKQGWSYVDILTHYYPGTSVG